MDIHEYQAKEILAGYGVPVPRGGLAYSPEQAAYRAREIGGNKWVVKAQVHTGGRGKAGGVKLCGNEHEVYDAADEMFGKRLVTHQSGPEGKIVYRVYVEGAVNILKEIYLGFVLDRKTERVMVVASASGGMEIEDIAADKPDTLIRSVAEPAVGRQAFQAREIAFGLGIPGEHIQKAVATIIGCYKALEGLDASMVEINPLVITEEGVTALDAKMTFDDNALFRHPSVAELRDKSQEDSRETRAADRGLSYVGLTGNIGCIVNGAGLAMATMDMIKLAGGEPANFLDVGGSANATTVEAGFRIILKDPNVKAILINIFGGIVRCDRVAQGVIDAYKKLGNINIPIIVRLQGTNAEAAQQLIVNSGLKVQSAILLSEAAELVQKAVNAN